MTSPSSRAIHYGWIIAAAGSLVLFSCFGLARYAYAMLLPAMQTGLCLSYDRMGFIGTANFVGYLMSVVLASRVLRRFTPRRIITGGLLLIGLCMIGMGLSTSYAAILVLYALVGAGGGFANIPLMALLTYWFRSERRGGAAGLVIAGNGAGIIFAGFLIPRLTGAYGMEGWQTGWLILGLISLAVALLALALLRNHPAEMGLEPVGRPVTPSEDRFTVRNRKGDAWTLLKLGILYMVFGATFMVYGTFIVTTLVGDYGFSPAKAGMYWSWAGFFSLFSGIGFGTVSDLTGRKRALVAVFGVQSAAYLLPGLKLGGAALPLSIALYGSAVFAIPAIMAAAVGDYLGLSRAATAFATVTIFFAVGQTIGPGAAGMIAKATGSFAGAYLACSVLTAAAAVFAAFLPQPDRS